MFFRVCALAILAVFYGCYFIKLLAQRRQGIRTNQLGRGKSGRARAVEIAVQTASTVVPLAEVASILAGTAPLPSALRAAGLALAMAGTVLLVMSVLTMKNSWRAGVSESEKTELVTRGVYSVSRNPAFLGFYLVYAGILLVFFNWPLLLATAAAVLLFHLQITLVEEPFLAKVFGGSYEEYRRSVSRYLGRRHTGGKGGP